MSTSKIMEEAVKQAVRFFTSGGNPSTLASGAEEVMKTATECVKQAAKDAVKKGLR